MTEKHYNPRLCSFFLASFIFLISVHRSEQNVDIEMTLSHRCGETVERNSMLGQESNFKSTTGEVQQFQFDSKIVKGPIGAATYRQYNVPFPPGFQFATVNITLRNIGDCEVKNVRVYTPATDVKCEANLDLKKDYDERQSKNVPFFCVPGTSSDDDGGKAQKAGLTTSSVVLISVGVVLFVVILAIVIWLSVRASQRRHKHNTKKGKTSKGKDGSTRPGIQTSEQSVSIGRSLSGRH